MNVVQVPADGILISGHSLAIDESSMTGESKIVRFSIFFSVAILDFIRLNSPIIVVESTDLYFYDQGYLHIAAQDYN